VKSDGLVFGKFLPLHTGHLALIQFALQHCRRVHVVICAADQTTGGSESIPGEERELWLQAHHLLENRVKVHLLRYDENELPNTSVSSREVSKAWAAKFKEFLPQLSVVFTSEAYGDFLAEYMGIEHLSFDPGRDLVPVSATAIREKPLTNWEYLPEMVRTYFVKRIAIVGTESTGKSVLAEKLAAHFNTVFVPELGREIIPNSKKTTLEDLYKIIDAQAFAVESSLIKADKVIFMDTGLPTTRSYARYFFGEELSISDKQRDDLRADLYLFLDADAPFIQDGTRLDKRDRDALQAALEADPIISGLEGQEVVRIGGNWEERTARAIEVVEAFLKLF
jgi:HTH-type transcriptional repressor of NAD biosynthesis genes